MGMKRKVWSELVLKRAEDVQAFEGRARLLKLMPKRVQPHHWDGPLPEWCDCVTVRGTETKWAISINGKTDPASQMPGKKIDKRVDIAHDEARAVLLCLWDVKDKVEAHYLGTVLVQEARDMLSSGEATLVQDDMDGEFGQDWIYSNVVAHHYCRQLIAKIRMGACHTNARGVRACLESLRRGEDEDRDR